MLGHKDIKTTQIYAKVVDTKKKDTTDKIVLDI
jgi:site-specific recombinase XerD